MIIEQCCYPMLCLIQTLNLTPMISKCGIDPRSCWWWYYYWWQYCIEHCCYNDNIHDLLPPLYSALQHAETVRYCMGIGIAVTNNTCPNLCTISFTATSFHIPLRNAYCLHIYTMHLSQSSVTVRFEYHRRFLLLNTYRVMICHSSTNSIPQWLEVIHTKNMIAVASLGVAVLLNWRTVFVSIIIVVVSI